MHNERKPQLGYSEIQRKMLDTAGRRAKARKIISVLHHFLGRDDLHGLSALDIGCSAGFTADELAADGAKTTGVDIDEYGLERARENFGGRVEFLCASGDDLPVPDATLDIVIFNHIYEHVVDPDVVITEIYRVLKPSGVAYLGLGNKYQIMEPHYRLPFLSWLPQRAADAYVRRFGNSDEYYERFRTYSGLKRMLRGFNVWDYTIPVITQPEIFGSTDQVMPFVSKLPRAMLNAALPIVPTFIWVASKATQAPESSGVAPGPKQLDLVGAGRLAPG